MQSQAEQPASPAAALAGPHDGNWIGRAKKSSGWRDCPGTVKLQVTVLNADVSGSISAEGETDEFTGKLDEEGRLRASISRDDDALKLQGSFSDGTFRGTLVDDDCRYAFKIARETD